jgi:hypothetical protein
MSLTALLQMAFQDGSGVSLPELDLSMQESQPASSACAFLYWGLARNLSTRAGKGTSASMPTLTPRSPRTLIEARLIADLGERLVDQVSAFVPDRFLVAGTYPVRPMQADPALLSMDCEEVWRRPDAPDACPDACGGP